MNKVINKYVDVNGAIVKDGDQVKFIVMNVADGTQISSPTIFTARDEVPELVLIAQNGQKFKWEQANYITGPFHCSVSLV